jgi:hypothetical protein
LPSTIVGDGDAEPTRRQCRYHRTIGAGQDSPPGALADVIQLAPFPKCQNLCVLSRSRYFEELRRALFARGHVGDPFKIGMPDGAQQKRPVGASLRLRTFFIRSRRLKLSPHGSEGNAETPYPSKVWNEGRTVVTTRKLALNPCNIKRRQVAQFCVRPRRPAYGDDRPTAPVQPSPRVRKRFDCRSRSRRCGGRCGD